jgi:hypothetical protein
VLVTGAIALATPPAQIDASASNIACQRRSLPFYDAFFPILDGAVFLFIFPFK